MTSETFDEAYQDTALLLGNAVATVARKAIRPELEPFIQHIGTVNDQLGQRLDDLQLIGEENKAELAKVKGAAAGLRERTQDLNNSVQCINTTLAGLDSAQQEWKATSIRLETGMGESIQTIETLVTTQSERWEANHQALLDATTGLVSSLGQLVERQNRQHLEYDTKLDALICSQQVLDQLIVKQRGTFDSGVTQFLQAQRDGVIAWTSSVDVFEAKQQDRLVEFRHEIEKQIQTQQALSEMQADLISTLDKEGTERIAAEIMQKTLFDLLQSNSQQLDRESNLLAELRTIQETSSEGLMKRIQDAECRFTEQANHLIIIRDAVKEAVEKDLSNWNDTQRQTVEHFQDDLKVQLDNQQSLLTTISSFDKRFAEEAQLRTQLMIKLELTVNDLQHAQLKLAHANNLGIGLFVLTLLVAILAGTASWHSLLQ